MYEIIVLFILALAWILFASVQDLRKREVANWLSFSLIIFALGFRFFYSLFSDSGFGFFYNGLIGFGVFLVIGNLLYYSRLFAGGDAKLMIALGAILPFSTNLSINIKLFITFLFLFFLAGAIYGLTITIYLSLKNFSSFKGEFKRKLKASKKWISFFIFVALMLIALGFLESIFFVLGILVFIFPYFYLYAKTVDSVCMVRRVKTKDITEGEWLYEGVRIGKKLIKPSWEGLSKEELILIRKKYKFIKIKQGIAFVPVFLIAFVIFFYMWEKGLWNAFW